MESIAQWVDLRLASAVRVRAAAAALSTEHRTLAVEYYGPRAVHRLNEEPETICREGLAWLERASHQKYGMTFMELNEQQQVSLIESVSDGRTGRREENGGSRFFELLKTETIRGYYTSHAGLKELDSKENGFYPVSPGCAHNRT